MNIVFVWTCGGWGLGLMSCVKELPQWYASVSYEAKNKGMFVSHRGEPNKRLFLDGELLESWVAFANLANVKEFSMRI